MSILSKNIKPTDQNKAVGIKLSNQKDKPQVNEDFVKILSLACW